MREGDGERAGGREGGRKGGEGWREKWREVAVEEAAEPDDGGKVDRAIVHAERHVRIMEHARKEKKVWAPLDFLSSLPH